jgi:hypothetical protein
MKRIAVREACLFNRGVGIACIIALLCLCVVFQMLGVPVTLLALLASDSPIESLSEDFSILPVILEPRTFNRIALYVEFQRLVYLPIFSTAIFRPPLG